MKKEMKSRMCIHCGEPRATREYTMGGKTFPIHAKCDRAQREEAKAEVKRLLATNGSSP